jgi:membrane-associated HD superfamily phosphohydrolase
LHSLIAVCVVYAVNNELWSFVNVVGVVFLIIDLFVTVSRRKGKEPRWWEKELIFSLLKLKIINLLIRFFPCFFIYIITMLPPIWQIEVNYLKEVILHILLL